MDRRRFYEWRARVTAGPSARQQKADELTARIITFHTASDGTYGAPRIRADLQDAGVIVSRKTVAKLMRDQGIAGISPRIWHPATTVHGGDPFPVPDLVERQFDQGERDIAWFSDITYLRTAWIPAVVALPAVGVYGCDRSGRGGAGRCGRRLWPWGYTTRIAATG